MTEKKSRKNGSLNKQDKEKSAKLAQEMIFKASQLPIVRVNREEFLRQQFKDSPYIEKILADGPQSVFTAESLMRKVDKVIKGSTSKTTVSSFLASLPSSNVALAVAGAGVDVTQYFGFAINLSLKIAYLYGADDFEELSSEEAQARIIVLLGTMLGIEGASSGLAHAFADAGVSIGKRIARQSLTKTTTWYPFLKSILSKIGVQITKKTISQTVAKSLLVVGAGISGLLTYATFKPLGNRISNVYYGILVGDYDVDMELRPEFVKELSQIIDNADFNIDDVIDINEYTVESEPTDNEDVTEEDI